MRSSQGGVAIGLDHQGNAIYRKHRRAAKSQLARQKRALKFLNRLKANQNWTKGKLNKNPRWRKQRTANARKVRR